jgi:hypothetical protein
MSNEQQKPRGIHEGSKNKGGVNPKPSTPKPTKAPPPQK